MVLGANDGEFDGFFVGVIVGFIVGTVERFLLGLAHTELRKR